ncbi:ScyD/ScyE family protein [Amycolatopsis sp. NPDC051373]|uniref:ScyD/ScyE family protein n=1 Tax=Amycolatopsis sp. NPDC051373 TaxID=3155801 RepID=UPI00344DD4B1
MKQVGRGKISVLAVFPVKMAPAPPALGLPPGTKVPMQSVPTSVVVGPDGALYVSELSSVGVGVARVWRVVPGHSPTIYADGLTALTDLAFDRKGRLLVVTFAEDGIAAPHSDGVLTRIETGPGHRPRDRRRRRVHRQPRHVAGYRQAIRLDREADGAQLRPGSGRTGPPSPAPALGGERNVKQISRRGGPSRCTCPDEPDV